ncbi:hypothetical protein [Pseudomonas gingeri]|uniref:hypothetical protein n=1 Tax=Pseudomonas gingeri TaxID=117681 RepID=UPI002108F185|nr:hypothetical protein [Pseudomonas gingeri]
MEKDLHSLSKRTTPMLSAQQACTIVLGLYDGVLRDGEPERFVIQSCELSANGDYWVVRSNSEDCVVRGMTEYCYVGVDAHLVDVISGAIETVASGGSVEEYLQDLYDLGAAAGHLYVLTPAFFVDDKPATINLRQKLACTYPQMLTLLSGERRQWLTGRRRHLQDAQRLLADHGVATNVELLPDAAGAICIGVEHWHIDAVLKAIRNRLL